MSRRKGKSWNGQEGDGHKDNWYFRVREQQKDSLYYFHNYKPQQNWPFENSLGGSLVMGSVSEGNTETLPFFLPGHKATLPDSAWR